MKLKRKLFSRFIFGSLFCPFANFLKLLPYITKMSVWIGWVVLFLFPTVTFSCFLGLTIVESPFTELSSILGWSLVYGIPTLLLWMLSFLYLKYYVLKENPIYQLMLLHPEGRRIIRGE